ncbi:MAG: hypothetical protein ABW217_23960, partial [Polyangiaceae bacterium]
GRFAADPRAKVVVSRFIQDWSRRYGPVVAYLLLGELLLWWIVRDATSSRVVTYSQGADYWEHAAALRALIESPWSPGNPQLASNTLSPRYTPVYLALALISRAAGWDALDAMALSAAVNVGLFLAGVLWFFALYFRHRLAPLYALCVLSSSWWLGWHYSNVYQLMILPSVAGYPSTTALGLSWFCFGLTALNVREGATLGRSIALGVLCWLTLLVHPLTAVMTMCGVGGIALFEPGSSRAARLWTLLSAGVGVLATHFWLFYSAFGVAGGGSYSGTANWAGRAANQALAGGQAAALHEFYDWSGLLQAFGLACPGFAFACWMLWRKQHLFVPLGLAAMLSVFVANAFVELPLGHRFVLLAIVFLHIAMVWGCLMLTPGYADAPGWLARRWARIAGPALVLGVLAVGVWHNLKLAAWRVPAESRGWVSPVLDYARVVAAIAGKGAVIMARSRDGWPVPAFGAKIVALHHPNPLVPDGAQRELDANTFFWGPCADATRKALLVKYGVTHVLLARGEALATQRFLDARASSLFVPGGYRLYQMR